MAGGALKLFDLHVSGNAVCMLKQCGYSGCVVFDTAGGTGDPDGCGADGYGADSVSDYGIADIVSSLSSVGPVQDFSISKGIEIRTNKATALRKRVDDARKHADIVAVYGGNESMNLAACKDSDVDVLVHPETDKDGGINHVIAKEARDHGVAIEFDLSRLIFLRGAERMKAVSDFGVNLMLARKYDVDIVLVSNAQTPFDVRMPRDMAALAGLFGMTHDEAYHAMHDVPMRIFRENAPGYITDGVEVIE